MSRSWVKKDKIKRDEVKGLSTDERVELARLRSENAELRMERECPQALRNRVGEGGDAVSLAAFIADQRTEHRVPGGRSGEAGTPGGGGGRAGLAGRGLGVALPSEGPSPRRR